MKSYTPREIVSELDKFIVGQDDAKRAVAIALRNRWRRRQVSAELRDEISPKNIIMIGPTGVGKTEIARRLARLADAPFIKVEASKFTEVGYVGRDVESIVRDLTELGVKLVKDEERKHVQLKAADLAEERLLDLLLPGGKKESEDDTSTSGFVDVDEEKKEPEATDKKKTADTRQKMRKMLREGKLDDREVDIEQAEKKMPMVEIFSAAGVEEMDMNMKDLFGNIFPKKTRRRKVKVAEALELLTIEEASKLVDMDKVTKSAIERVEQSGIVFIDEIDKIAGRHSGQGPEVSREGVQRDLLPIVEGSTVNTKYGMVRTDHILFIASGAFHTAKPSDLIPEFQGRFPIRVELSPLKGEDFVRILKEPKNALTIQYAALLETEGIEVEFTDDSIEELASIAASVNDRMENIGARRLQTVMERVFDELSFEASDMGDKKVVIDSAYVRERLNDILEDEDLSRYIL